MIYVGMDVHKESITIAVRAESVPTPSPLRPPARQFIASRDRGLIFQIDKTPANARYWDMFDHAMNVRRPNSGSDLA